MKLELKGITKRFGDMVANDHIDLLVQPGEIHALLGENGAGKSTLMNVVFGLLTADAGQVLVDDVALTLHSPRDAMAAGIGMVHQHFMLVPVFTVAENVMLGHESVRAAGLLDREAARELVRDISSRFGLDVHPDAMVEDLPVGVQQRVEIIKALARHAKVLILDEPTAVLTPQETDELLTIMRGLRDQGTAIVFITHKLREVRAAADRITVIRRGKVVGEASPETSEGELAALMVGRSVSLTVDKAPRTPGQAVLEVAGLTVRDGLGRALVEEVSFTVHAGEVLAVAGVQGNGQTELTEALLGLQDHVSGSITLDGKPLRGATTNDILDSGVGYVPEDREQDGLVPSFSLAENMILDVFDRPPYASGLVMRQSVVREKAGALLTEFDIRAPGIDATAASLSGGNKQKLVLSRELSRPIKLLVAAQPTRGLDVGSIEFVHRRIIAERDNGVAVLIISSELDEVFALADRIAVMYRGRIIAVVPAGISRSDIGLLMAGVQPGGGA